MFQFSAFASIPYAFRHGFPINREGFPIQKSQDRCSVASSSGLIAGSHVFHRLLTPRHPPYALSSLITPTCNRYFLRLTPTNHLSGKPSKKHRTPCRSDDPQVNLFKPAVRPVADKLFSDTGSNSVLHPCATPDLSTCQRSSLRCVFHFLVPPHLNYLLVTGRENL